MAATSPPPSLPSSLLPADPECVGAAGAYVRFDNFTAPAHYDVRQAAAAGGGGRTVTLRCAYHCPACPVVLPPPLTQLCKGVRL